MWFANAHRYCVMACAVVLGCLAIAAESMSIAISPRYPWNGKVDLKFTIGADETEGGYAAHQPGDDAIAGYRLKYVQSAGDAQLNTGVVPGSKNTIELKFAFDGTPASQNQCLYCARGATTATASYTCFLLEGRWRFDYNSASGTESTTPTPVSGVPMVIRTVAGSASVDGVAVQSYTAANFTVGGQLALFSSYVEAPGTRLANYLKGKIYYLKIFGDDGTTLLHDFVPWEKDGVVGMYDTIAARFVAPNVGTLTCGTRGPKYDTSFTAKDVAGGTNLTMKTLYKSNGTAANVGKESLLPGDYRWVWDAGEDLTRRWVTYSGCVPTNSAVLFSNVQLSELSEFYAVPCGKAVSDKSNLAKGAYIKDDGAGKSVQFAFSDDVFTKCVCVHLEQSGPNVVGYAKWARYVTGTGYEKSDFDTTSTKTMTVAISETEAGYGLLKLEAKGVKLDSAPVLERVVAEGNIEVSAFLYTVKFNANGGTGTMVDEPLAYGIEKALTANAFTRTGYTFQGWATSATGAKVYSDKQSVSNLTTTAGAMVNLYAVWKASAYTVKFNANGGTGTMANESFTYGTAKALTANAFKRTGYTFQGWATSATGAKVYSDKQSVNNLTTTAGATVNLYAVWAPGGVQLWANGPYWAECNVGATKPEEYGYYFWWGDTVGCKRNSANNGWVSVKDGSSCSFDWGSEKNPSYGKDDKELKSAGFVDSTGNLVAKHDAATVYWGASWRMPTVAEMSALISKCTISSGTRNGVKGMLIKGKGDYSSKSIFLPFAGYGSGSKLNLKGSDSICWSSTMTSGLGAQAERLVGTSGGVLYTSAERRDDGYSVRPVRVSAQ